MQDSRFGRKCTDDSSSFMVIKYFIRYQQSDDQVTVEVSLGSEHTVKADLWGCLQTQGHKQNCDSVRMKHRTGDPWPCCLLAKTAFRHDLYFSLFWTSGKDRKSVV